MEGRRVLEKHKHFAMYRPSAYYVAQVIADIPLSILQAILFELCCYFIMGLILDAGRVRYKKEKHFNYYDIHRL